MALTALCRALLHLCCRKLDMPSYTSPMKLDTSVVIIPHFCFLGIWGRSNLSHFLGCYAQCYYMILSIFYNKLLMVKFSYKRSSSLTYIFLFLYFVHFYYSNMHMCWHYLILKTVDPLSQVIQNLSPHKIY